MSKARRILMAFTWYVLGVISVFVVAAICVRFDLGPHTQHEMLVRNWRLHEEAPGRLVIPPFETDEWMVWISRDPETKELKSVQFVIVEGVMFKYDVVGEFGVPAARYTAGSVFENGLQWQDVNTDGRFDVRVDVAKKCMEIFVKGRWLEAIRPDTVAETDEGKFKFNVESGKWEAIDQGSE